MLRLITKLLRLHPKPQAEPDDSAIYVPEANAPMATVLGSEDGKVKAGAASVAWDNITGIPSGGMPPALHAPTHQHGGDDEVATGIPSAFAIPKAGEDGKLAEGWLPDSAYENIYNTDGTLTGHRTVTCDRKFFVIVDAFLWGVSLPTASDGSYVLISNPDLPATDYWQLGTKDDEHMIQGYIGGLLLQATTKLFVKSPAVIAATAVAGQVPTLVNATTGETEFADVPPTDPAGSDREIQFNDGGVFGARENATFLELGAPSWVNANLKSYWTLNETSGTRFDSIGTNDLTDNNTVGSAAGILNNAADFTAANSEYLSHASNSDLQWGNNARTIVLWVNLDSKASTVAIVAKHDAASAAGSEYILTYNQPADRFRLEVYSGGTTYTADANVLGSPSTGTWYMIVIYHDPATDTAGISVNGGAANTVAVSSSGVNATAAAFGLGAIAVGGGTIPINGKIDETLIYHGLLTALEISQMYGGGAPAGLDGYFRQVLKALSGQSAYILEIQDSGGNVLHGIKPVAPVAYTISNDTTDRSFDCNSTSVDELADALATLIDDLNNRFGGFK